jgi:Zn-finger nucleic acid-binding protein
LIDKCETCGGIWLDPNELKLIARIVGVNAAVGGYLMGNIADDI